MPLIKALIGVGLLTYVLTAAFAMGVTGSLDGHMNLYGVSGFFWFFFLLFVCGLGGRLTSAIFGLSETRTYSHTEVTVTHGTGTARNIYLSPRDRRASTIASLVSLTSFGLALYTAAYYPSRPNLQAIWENEAYLAALNMVELSAGGILAIWSWIASIFGTIFS
ncbi:MAG: hypothetical protein AAFX02_11745 [Pseudomonadota bacterium]